MWLLLLACAPDDRCEAMCDAALSRFEVCLGEGGLEWGASVGYQGPADYQNWCETWTWEVRQLGEQDQCATKEAVFADGTCEEYYAAWSP